MRRERVREREFAVAAASRAKSAFSLTAAAQKHIYEIILYSLLYHCACLARVPPGDDEFSAGRSLAYLASRGIAFSMHHYSRYIYCALAVVQTGNLQAASRGRKRKPQSDQKVQFCPNWCASINFRPQTNKWKGQEAIKLSDSKRICSTLIPMPKKATFICIKK